MTTRYYQKYMDQYGSQGKGSGYKKYFQKYMGSNGGGYERFMAVSSWQISVCWREGFVLFQG